MLNGLLRNEINQNEFLNANNITIIYKNIPVLGLTFTYRDINIILINKLTKYSFMKEICLHEIAHIELDHLSSNKSKIICEYEANELINNLI